MHISQLEMASRSLLHTRPSIFTSHTSYGTSRSGSDKASAGHDEDTVSATPSTQSLFGERFFVAAATQACDLAQPEHASRFLSLLQCRGAVTGYWPCPSPACSRPLTASTIARCSDITCASRCTLSRPPVPVIRTPWISLGITRSSALGNMLFQGSITATVSSGTPWADF